MASPINKRASRVRLVIITALKLAAKEGTRFSVTICRDGGNEAEKGNLFLDERQTRCRGGVKIALALRRKNVLTFRLLDLEGLSLARHKGMVRQGVIAEGKEARRSYNYVHVMKERYYWHIASIIGVSTLEDFASRNLCGNTNTKSLGGLDSQNSPRQVIFFKVPKHVLPQTYHFSQFKMNVIFF